MISINYKKNIDTAGTLSISVQLRNLLTDRQSASVSYSLEGDNGDLLDTGTLNYEGEDFSYFWENFNSVDFLGQEIKTKKGLSVPPIDEDFVLSFGNEKNTLK